MEKIEKVYKRYPRRKIDSHSYTMPDASLDVRVLINRTAKGLPINAKMSKHVALPPDGGDLKDFTTGTEEIIDVVDAVQFADKIRAEQAYIAEEKEKAIKEATEAPVPPVVSSTEA